ncbi:MAG: DUF4177 domain-containing protein [Roseimicrobium sp.]
MSMSEQWEYLTESFGIKNSVFSGPKYDNEDMKTKLNQLGREGWEVVTMTPVKESSGHGTALLLAVLKRRLASGADGLN